MYVELNSYYSDWGAYAIDNSTLEVIVETEGVEDVDISQAGTYLITYTATDSEGNTALKIRTVIVQ